MDAFYSGILYSETEERLKDRDKHREHLHAELSGAAQASPHTALLLGKAAYYVESAGQEAQHGVAVTVNGRAVRVSVVCTKTSLLRAYRLRDDEEEEGRARVTYRSPQGLSGELSEGVSLDVEPGTSFQVG